MNKDKTPIAFAFYKNGELIGYRQDTVGTIGMYPKIYHYSEDQVETVMKNIEYNVKNKEGLGKALLDCIGESMEVAQVIIAEADTHNLLQDKKVFEVRVVEVPAYEKQINLKTGEWETDILGGYPHEAIKIWLQHPENHETIETHYFSMDGKINLQ